MLTWLLYIVLASGQVPAMLSEGWFHRYIILLNIEPKTKPLAWSLVGAANPVLNVQQRWLPVEEYELADLERNNRLYGVNTVRLKPSMVILHFTVVDDAESVIWAFSRPSRLPVGNKTPVLSLTSVHYMVDQESKVYQMVPEHRMTTGSYGVDHLALSIEMVAKNEKDLLSRPLQLLTTFHLVDSLLKRHNIPPWRVFSHQEIALGKLFFNEYTDLADTVSPYFYPKRDFRYDPGPTVMAWCREFLLRRRGLWERHPASKTRAK